MTANYRKNYRALGIAPGTNWKQLRQAYKKLINIWHPDRYGQDPHQKRLAEEKTKEINQSYKELSEYYKKNGALPLAAESDIGARNLHDDPNPDVPPEPTAGVRKTPAAATDAASAEPRRKSKGRARIIASMALLGSIYFIWQSASRDPDGNLPERNDGPAANGADAKPAEAAPEKRFTVGSSLGEVYSIQGVPTRTEKDIWHYGSSKVYFSKGKVLRWEESHDNPLQVDILARPEKGGSRFFSRGSTKEEVLTAQGRPDRDAGSVWDYGLSRVYFEKDRVTGWQEAPLNPLRVR